MTPLRFALAGLCLAVPTAAQELGNMWGTANAEAKHYRIIDLPLPVDPQLEVG
ncbi:MAG: hypothetical protein ACI90M_004842, partial [Candidatus Azotimanducaceae bacterium]